MMGAVATITADSFPKQSPCVGQKARVCFHYDLTKILPGTVVRDDMEEPRITIIALEDGRHVMSTECQYTL